MNEFKAHCNINCSLVSCINTCTNANSTIKLPTNPHLK